MLSVTVAVALTVCANSSSAGCRCAGRLLSTCVPSWGSPAQGALISNRSPPPLHIACGSATTTPPSSSSSSPALLLFTLSSINRLMPLTNSHNTQGRQIIGEVCVCVFGRVCKSEKHRGRESAFVCTWACVLRRCVCIWVRYTVGTVSFGVHLRMHVDWMQNPHTFMLTQMCG